MGALKKFQERFSEILEREEISEKKEKLIVGQRWRQFLLGIKSFLFFRKYNPSYKFLRSQLILDQDLIQDYRYWTLNYNDVKVFLFVETTIDGFNKWYKIPMRYDPYTRRIFTNEKEIMDTIFSREELHKSEIPK